MNLTTALKMFTIVHCNPFTIGFVQLGKSKTLAYSQVFLFEQLDISQVL
jgi:hypothetical protein